MTDEQPTAVEVQPALTDEQPTPTDEQPTPTAPTPGRPRVLLTGLAGFALFVVAGLLIAALVPLLWGWSPYAVGSGSMAPRVPTGSVVVAQPHHGEDLGPGTVIVFERGGREVTHRIVSVDDDGRYRTRGDANAAGDVRPVAPEQVVGVGRMLVPFVGWPVVWLQRGDLTSLTLTAVLLAGAAHLVHASWRTPTSDRAPRRRAAPVQPTVGLLVALLAVPVAGAVFSTSAATGANTWRADSSFGAAMGEVTASDLPEGGNNAVQAFTFTLDGALPAGETITIDLDEAHPTFARYHSADAPASSHGSAVLEADQGVSAGSTARVVVTADAPIPTGEVITVGIGGGIRPQQSSPDVPVTFTRSDSGASATATFAVDPSA